MIALQGRWHLTGEASEDPSERWAKQALYRLDNLKDQSLERVALEDQL